MTTYTPNQYRSTIRDLGKRLFAVALDWSRTSIPASSQAEIMRQMEAIKGRKSWPTKKATLEAGQRVRKLAVDLSAARAHRRPRCNMRGDRGYNRNITFGCPRIAILSNIPLAERVRNRRRQLILSASSNQREDYSGDTETVISYGEPTAETATYRGEQYSRSCAYNKTDAEHRITVHPDWFSRVHQRGLDSVDGMLTLDAEPIDAEGYTVYRAIWLRSKGKRLSAESGYIAIGEHGAAHAKTEAGAKAILTRRANEARFAKHERKIRQALQEMRLNGYAQITVTLADSYAAGNCKPGTLEFRDRHFPGRDSATIEELLAVDSMRAMAINACLHAIRRARIDHEAAA